MREGNVWLSLERYSTIAKIFLRWIREREVPNWKRVAKDIVRSVDHAARESREVARRQSARGGRSTSSSSQYDTNNICRFWDCDNKIRTDHVLCYEHYGDLQDGRIDDCPDCKRAKHVDYDVCLDCYRKTRTGQASPKPSSESKTKYKRYEREHSTAWEKRDATASEFFVYLLKLNGGDFYPGQTRELRERLSEHRDDKVASTAGQNPKLVWFSILPTREAATEYEVHLKKLADSNPRELRRMIIRLHDLVDELDYS